MLFIEDFGLPAEARSGRRGPPSPRLRRATFAWIMREGWRRRPDLNRGWRFCKQGRDVYLVDSSCFLVGPTSPFSLVFGRNRSQVVPNLLRPLAVRVETPASLTTWLCVRELVQSDVYDFMKTLAA